jgi:HK97 family phage major capsid protein
MTPPTPDQVHRTNAAMLDLFKKLAERRGFAREDAAFLWERRTLQQACVAVTADPDKALWLRAIGKRLAHAPQSSFTEEENRIFRALTTGDSGLGQGLSVFEPLATDVYNLMLRYGAFRTLGVVPLATGKTKLASVTGKANAVWFTPTNQGTTIPSDASITGSSISPECATLAALVEVSGEALADGKTTFEAALLQAIVEGLNYRLDVTCFQADGTDDTFDGGMTGIFADANVPIATAAAGRTEILNLQRADFVAVVAAVTPSALQRDCRWWIAPQLLPKLLPLKDGETFLLAPPAVPGGEWSLLGWPITWTVAAPSADQAGAKIAAFGCGAYAYAVALRQDFEIRSSAEAKWDQNLWLFRAIARARCLMRDATSLAVLKLAS